MSPYTVPKLPSLFQLAVQGWVVRVLSLAVVRLESGRAAVARGQRRGRSALIASDTSRSCRLVADELNGILAEVTGGSRLLYDSLRPDSLGTCELLCAVREHLARPCLPVAVVLLQTLCNATLLDAASARQTLPTEMAELDCVALGMEAAVRASCSYWLALQAALEARCAQLAPTHRPVHCLLCVHWCPHQLLVPAWQLTPLSNSAIYPAAETMLHGVVDLSHHAFFACAAADASWELSMACSGFNNHTDSRHLVAPAPSVATSPGVSGSPSVQARVRLLRP